MFALLQPIPLLGAMMLATAPPPSAAGLARTGEPRAPHGELLESLRQDAYSALIIDMDGSVLASHLPDRRRQPASVVKLITASTVGEALGLGYTFATEFYRDANTLYVKGFGDPYLTTDQLHMLIRGLPRDLSFDTLVVDDSFFASDLGIVQEPNIYQPYNAQNSAVAANFNTIGFIATRNATVIPESQTPWVDFVDVNVVSDPRANGIVTMDLVKDSLKIHIKAMPSRSYSMRLHLGFDPRTAALYAGHLFVAVGQRQGRPWRPLVVLRGRVPDHAELVHVHHSTWELATMLREFLKSSNNFVANQLLLTAGAYRFDAPASLAKGLEVMHAQMQQHLSAAACGAPPHPTLFEASGLDPRNRLTVCELAHFLVAQAHVSPDYPGLLPSRLEGRVHAKTGTFRDKRVRSLAGYVAPSGQRDRPALAFAFICNGPPCNSATQARYRRVLARVVEHLDRSAPPQTARLAAETAAEQHLPASSTGSSP